MSLISLIDTLLPQTQCTKCGHQGCKPYAEAIAQGEEINKCPPGGEETIKALATLLDKPVVPLAEPFAPAKIAFIREAECIGCTKCIQACPVDAIVGAAKLMHTVIAKECTGCDLCVTPCPVDCIDMVSLPEQLVALTGDSVKTEEERISRQLRRDHARARFDFHKLRLSRDARRKQEEKRARVETILTQGATKTIPSTVVEQVKAKKSAATILSVEQKRLKIELAMVQVAFNKVEKQLKQHNTTELQQQLDKLTMKLAEAQLAFNQSLDDKGK